MSNVLTTSFVVLLLVVLLSTGDVVDKNLYDNLRVLMFIKGPPCLIIERNIVELVGIILWKMAFSEFAAERFCGR